MDWGDGDYELTARVLEPVSLEVIDAAGVSPGQRVLDVGCGTGNAALAAARRGASVVGVDPATRLLEVAHARANAEQLDLTFQRAEAASLPVPDASFDVLLSVFAVIFAPDAEAAAREMLRVLRPGGRLVLTTWTAEGPVFEAGSLLMQAAMRGAPPPASRPAWGELAFLQRLFAPARVTAVTRSISFEADSAEDWFRQQEHHHPAWRSVKQLLANEPGAWSGVRERSIDALQAHNERVDGFRVTSRYLLATVTR